MKYKNKISSGTILLIFSGIFITPFTLRTQYLSTSLTTFYRTNFLAILGIGLLLIIAYRKTKDTYLCSTLLCLALIPCLYSMITAGNHRATIIIYLTCCIIPVSLLFISINQECFKQTLLCILIIFDIFIVFLLIFAIGDYFFDRFFVRKLSQTFTTYFEVNAFAYYEDNEHLRFYSLWGHPLTNAVLFNFFFFINTMYNKYIKSFIPTIICFGITFIGIAMTASKTGLVVILGMAIITFYNKVYAWILCFLFTGISYKLGLLTSILNRLLNSPLDSSRNDMWQIAKTNNAYPLQFTYGYGFETAYIYNEKIPDIKAAYEYPIRMFSLDNGILFACIIIGILLIYPSYRLLKKKHIYIWMMYMGIFLEVNTYNGISLTLDCMLIFCFFTMIILNISDCISENEIHWKGKVLFKNEKQ